MIRSVGAGLAALFVSGCGGVHTVPSTSNDTSNVESAIECSIAARLEPRSDGALAENGGTSVVPPTSSLVIVRLCDGMPSQATQLGSLSGICHIEGLISGVSARCWWRGESTVVEVRRSESSIVATQLDSDGPRMIGSIALPENAEVSFVGGLGDDRVPDGNQGH